MTNNQMLLYQTEDGETRVEVLHQDETLWLSQRDMAKLFQRDVKTVNRHIQNIYADGELSQDRTISYFEIVQKEGKRTVTREVTHYNLDMIISVGYRVNSIPRYTVPHLGNEAVTGTYHQRLCTSMTSNSRAAVRPTSMSCSDELERYGHRKQTFIVRRVTYSRSAMISLMILTIHSSFSLKCKTNYTLPYRDTLPLN